MPRNTCDEDADPGAAIRTSTRSGACLTSTNTRTYRLPYTTHGKVDIEVAVSNPCMELWLVLHAEDQTAHISRRNVQRRASELQLTFGKGIPDSAWGTLFDEFETAQQRAKALDQRHAGNGSPPRSNPGTDIWQRVDRIRHDQPRHTACPVACALPV